MPSGQVSTTLLLSPTDVRYLGRYVRVAFASESGVLEKRKHLPRLGKTLTILGVIVMSSTPVCQGYVQAGCALAVGATAVLAARFLNAFLKRCFSVGSGAVPIAAPAVCSRIYQPRQGVVLAAVCAVVLGFGALGWNKHRASIHLMDELCGLYQAGAFQNLSATVPLTRPPRHRVEPGECILESDKGSFALQAPGFAAVIALGETLGIPRRRIPWILTVATVGVGAVGCCLLAGPLSAVIFAALLFTNPFLNAVSQTYLAHTLSALLLVLGVVGSLVYGRGLSVSTSVAGEEPLNDQRGSAVWSSILGGVGGLLLLTRPLLGVGFCLYFLGLHVVSYLFQREKKEAVLRLSAACVGPISAALLYMLFNHATTGSFFLTGYEMAFGEKYLPGFWGVSSPGEVHTPRRAFLLLLQHTRDLYPFVTFSVIRFFALLGAVAVVVPNRALTRAMAALVLVWGALSLFHDASYFVGPRYYYESMFILALVMMLACDRVARHVASVQQNECKRAVVRTIAFCVLLLFLWPR